MTLRLYLLPEIYLLTKRKDFELNWKTSAPIPTHLNNHLEELSFIKIFPFDIDGFVQPLDYYFQKLTSGSHAKARVMSSNSRYQCVD